MNTYISRGFKSVKADSISEAAAIFATRQAKKENGKRGYYRTLNSNSWSQDGSTVEYNSFIGYSSGRNETTGRNFMFTVSRKD